MPNEEWSLIIGEAVSPFGIKGEVKVRLETDFPERFARLKQVCLRWPGGRTEIRKVQGTRLHKNQALVRFENVDTMDDAEALRGAFLMLRPEEAVTLPPDEFYIHDLVGCEVITAEGRSLGKLTAVLRGPVHDVYQIDQGRNETLLPAIRDVVQKVDLEARRIVVTPTPGLLPGEEDVVS